jgi:hypothetical protein
MRGRACSDVFKNQSQPAKPGASVQVVVLAPAVRVVAHAACADRPTGVGIDAGISRIFVGLLLRASIK